MYIIQTAFNRIENLGNLSVNKNLNVLYSSERNGNYTKSYFKFDNNEFVREENENEFYYKYTINNVEYIANYTNLYFHSDYILNANSKFYKIENGIKKEIYYSEFENTLVNFYNNIMLEEFTKKLI